MKKSLIFLTIAATSIILMGCNKEKIQKITPIGDHFYEVETYTSLNYKSAEKYYKDTYDNWGGGCSAISKTINGKKIVGRNMDLNISRKCAFLVRTDIPNKYKTFGLSYTFRSLSPDLEDLKKNGLGVTWSNVLPFMCDDVMNSEGLHIEVNMRHNEADADGNDIFAVEHTNPKAPERIYVFGISQYLALNCRNLEDVKKYLANNVDVYSMKNYWNYCFLITDAEGNSELLEFGKRKYYFVEPNKDGVICQTNYYINEECNSIEKVKSGTGRYDVLMNNINQVKDKTDMFNLMKKVQYSSFYIPYAECKSKYFDPRSEIVGENVSKELLIRAYKKLMGDDKVVPSNISMDAEFIMDDANEEFVSKFIDYIHTSIWGMTRDEKAQLNYDDDGANAVWESTFTEVVIPKDRTIYVRLFENDSVIYEINMTSITVSNGLM